MNVNRALQSYLKTQSSSSNRAQHDIISTRSGLFVHLALDLLVDLCVDLGIVLVSQACPISLNINFVST